ncbi:MAG: hypothetical protein Q9222_002553 [Ikaeria aurantiellina]
MANTAPKVAEKERRESMDVVEKKAQLLVDKIKKSKHFIAFTGAGISTSAGIPDFRGSEGVWTLKRQGRMRDLKAVNTLQAVPTSAHMCLVELQNRGILKYLVSQNCDGLHRKSGILPDTIINFGEFLPAEPLERARTHAKKADFCLVLGSSLTVPPANSVPEMIGQRRGGQLAICNLQSTPIDHLSDLRVYTSADELMVRVMKKLDIPIPTFNLHRRLLVKVETTGDERHQLTLVGVDVDGTPVTFLKSVKLDNNRRVVRSEPYAINFRGSLNPGTSLTLQLEFMGHYGEPNLQIIHECTGKNDAETLYLLEYNPQTREWKTEKPESWDTGEGIQDDVEKEEDSVLLCTDPNGIPDGIKPTGAIGMLPDDIIEID